jgi:hypothetical protein
MHVLRARDNNTGKEIGLRQFYKSNNDWLNNWMSVMNSLTMFQLITNEWQSTDENEIWWHILGMHPNNYGYFPIFVFLHEYGNISPDNGCCLNEKYCDDYKNLLKTTVKYFFVKGVVYNAANSIRPTVFKVCSLIENNGDYLSEYTNNMAQDISEFERKVTLNQFGSKYITGLTLISSFLNPKQDHADFHSIINNCHIEHILPKKWNNYDYWTEEDFRGLTPLIYGHVNPYGSFKLNMDERIAI